MTSEQHLRRLCSRFVARRSICDACKQLLRRQHSRFHARSSICDAWKQHLRRLCSRLATPANSICGACAADLTPEGAFATPVQQIQHLRRLSEAAFARPAQQICCWKQHLRRLCNRFDVRSSVATPVQEICCQKQHLRRLCSGFVARSSNRNAWNSICNACAAPQAAFTTPVQDSAPAKPVKAAFATPVQQIRCQKQHS